jgi:hypothetical protein
MNDTAKKLDAALQWLKEAALSDEPSTKSSVASRVKLLREALVSLLPAVEMSDVGIECDPDQWENDVANSCTGPEQFWMSRKFIYNLREHKQKHPAFIPERVARFFVDEPNQKIRVWLCYQPVSDLTKQVHKNLRFRSYCDSQS